MAFRVFKRRNSSYQTWHEDNKDYGCTDSLIETDTGGYNDTTPMSSINEETDSADSFATYGSVAGDEHTLLECFYLGSFNMSGRVVTGRGCIDEPAAQIWRHTQEECKRGNGKRKPSLPLEFIECKPKYIRLVAGKDHLKIVDQYSEQTLFTFSHRCISFTGTHPKYTKMFCFIAWEPKNRIPYCHAFKCEDSLSAKAGALRLSDIFKKRCSEIMSQSNVHTSSPRHVLRKTQSLRIC